MNLEVGTLETRADGSTFYPIRKSHLNPCPFANVAEINTAAFNSDREAERFAHMFILSHTKLTHLPITESVTK